MGLFADTNVPLWDQEKPMGWWERMAKFFLRLKEIEEECEANLSLVSMRPQPGSPNGDAWEAGFRYAWELRNRLQNSDQSF